MGTYINAMYNQKLQTLFKKKIRIKPEQLEYIRSVKGDYTLAGRLDEIINFYKKRKKTTAL
jgi:hypothetical protein